MGPPKVLINVEKVPASNLEKTGLSAAEEQSCQVYDYPTAFDTQAWPTSIL
jgi:hypothetical protein